MIINEQPNLKEDPNLLINEGAVCGNCPYSLPNNKESRSPTIICCYEPLHMGVHKASFCSHHPCRFMAVTDAELNQAQKEIERPAVTNPQAMGYTDQEDDSDERN